MAAFDDLLTVQEHDSAADRLRHRRASLPEQARLAEAQKAIAELGALRAEVSERRDEVVRRQQRVEDELATLEDKIKELDRKLYSGTITIPRELQAMQADVQSLKRHQSDLEDQVLAAMQDADPLDVELRRLDGERASLDSEAETLRQAIDEAAATIDADLVTELEARARAAEAVPAELISQYERLRAKLGGIGAARLVGNMCGGCHLALPATEVDRIRHAAPDAVVLCDQCGRILVR
jgi:predicted  nucleic acid-binding Zn-ribbon protein